MKIRLGLLKILSAMSLNTRILKFLKVLNPELLNLNGLIKEKFIFISNKDKMVKQCFFVADPPTGSIYMIGGVLIAMVLVGILIVLLAVTIR